MDKRKTVFYQINLRMFTPEGTLRAAEKFLPHIASIGVDVVYLCPVNRASDDRDERFWSFRQKKNRLGNPKNPYRLQDFYAIDEEYGTEEDLRDFIREAHRLGLLVMLDLVYMHCGPDANIISLAPDSVKRDENGTICYTQYNFPILNFECRATREHLIENMLHFVRDLDVDGFRCDVGDAVPLDFWREAKDAVLRVKPNLLLLNEGCDPHYVTSGVFDFNYNLPPVALLPAEILPVKVDTGFGSFLLQNERTLAEVVRDNFHRYTAGGNGKNGIYYLESHDVVTDEDRFDAVLPSACVDALFVYIFMADGIPFLYAGNEFADNHEQCMFANRFYNRGYRTDWSRLAQPEGQRRLQLIRDLIRLRRATPAVLYGDFCWLSEERNNLYFAREWEGKRVAVFINFGDAVSACTKGEILLSANATPKESGGYTVEQYGYIVAEDLFAAKEQ